MHFVTKDRPMHYIYGNGHKLEAETLQELFNQSYKVQSMPLVIYGLRSGDAHITHY